MRRSMSAAAVSPCRILPPRPTARRNRLSLVILALVASAMTLGFASVASANTVNAQQAQPNPPPPPLALGQTNVPQAIRVVGAGAVTSIIFVPSCGVPSGNGNCPAANVDPGVFRLSSTGTGQAGTTCAGTTFTIANIDPTQGKYEFQPDRPVIVGPGNTLAEQCLINFTLDVLRFPAVDAFPGGGAGGPGAHSGWSIIGATSDPTPVKQTNSNAFFILRATPSLTAQVSPSSISLGSSFHDTATLAGVQGVPAPTGSVTFNVYGPADFDCAQLPIMTSTVPASPTTVSGDFTPTSTGTYNAVASYSGDANYAPSKSSSFGCDSPSETETVNNASSATATGVGCSPGSVAVNSSTTCTAMVTDTSASPTTPTGTVSFSNGQSCVVAGSGSSAGCSAPYSPAAVGSNNITATYGGDSTHAPSNGSTSVSATKRSTGSSLSCSPGPVAMGASTTCAVTVSDTDAPVKSAPSGNVTFSNGNSCALVAAFSSSSCSTSFTPSAFGANAITATYDGDATHLGSSATTSVTVNSGKASLAISTQVTPAAFALGGSFRDAATLSGAPAGGPPPNGVGHVQRVRAG